jgi:hypothetical protein
MHAWQKQEAKARLSAHEMMESLDPKYDSDVGRSLMMECERFLDSATATEASTKQT